MTTEVNVKCIAKLVLLLLASLLIIAFFVRENELRNPKKNLVSSIEWALHAGLNDPSIITAIAKKYIPLGSNRDKAIFVLTNSGFSFAPNLTGVSDLEFSKPNAEWRKDDWLNTYSDIIATKDAVLPPLCIVCFDQKIIIRLHFLDAKLAGLDAQVEMPTGP